MKKIAIVFIISILGVLKIEAQTASKTENLTIEGLQAPVEIIVDHWGIPHIYAQNEADLFFAQGFNAARDRLFQFEIWRRQATGTVAEILGERELKRDIGTRLFQFRGDIKAEMNHYHDRGELIITSYVRGVNKYIELTKKDPSLLPIEFKLLGIKPQKWTPEVVISRHQGLLGNIGDELKVGRQVAMMGAEKTKELGWFHPNDPILELDPKIDKDALQEDILELYNAYRRPVRFQPEDLVADARNDWQQYQNLAAQEAEDWDYVEKEERAFWGSNNWVVSGEHTQSGYPMMANDPHRTQSTPSLRYMSHLVAPGWDVIGGGEPEIPGISIGHNQYGAWGLTVFRTDAEDLYVYEINPENPNQYQYHGRWEDMVSIEDEIPVKGKKAHKVTHKYTRHGPVVFEDKERNIAYAVRCGWLEIGGSPYLASLRMDQAKDFEEFKAACNYSNIPGENMVWVDKKGNIGWQAVGIAPVRRNFSGMVPVPGDGSYEWDGYLPIIAKPNIYNPESGIFITSNENVTPNDYIHKDALGFSWADPFRGDRVAEELHGGKKQTLQSMAALQTDYYSIPARELTPLLKELNIEDEQTVKAQQMLLAWDDFQLDKNSVEAGIYVAWERALKQNMTELLIPEEVQPFHYMFLKKVIDWLVLPDNKFGANPLQGRDDFLVKALENAVQSLNKKLGTDMTKWQYGQAKYKHIYLKHPLSNAVKADMRQKLDVGPAPRGGNGYTVGSTGGRDNQPSGGSFRIIVDCVDWDVCLGTNSPGQSGNPDDPFYDNLFDSWAKDKFFPVFYSREKVERVVAKAFVLNPPRK
ncbi:MAG: penicillin acylase family protein [Bacteroidota bacterium]